nr:MAG TPA: hypothetical protein [Caudoviricetes sp.]
MSICLVVYRTYKRHVHLYPKFLSAVIFKCNSII